MDRMKKRFAALCCTLLVITAVLSGCSVPVNNSAPNPSPFEALTNEVFEDAVTSDALSFHFMLKNPEDYNISLDEYTLGRISLDDAADSIEDNKDLLKRLEAIDDATLSEDEKLTKEILIDTLETENALNKYPLLQEPVNPLSGQQAMLPILFNEYTFYTETDVKNYLKLLEDVGPFFESILDFEKEKAAAGTFMTEDVLDDVIDQCRTFSSDVDNNLMIVTFPDKLADELPDLNKQTRDKYIAENKAAVENHVIPAYNELTLGLESLRSKCSKNGSLSDYENGREYYAALCRDYTGTDMTPEELAALLEKKMQEAITQLSFSLAIDQRVADAYLNGTPPVKSGEPSALLKELSSLVTEDFPKAADISYEVKYVDEALRDYLSPAFYINTPIDAYKDNTIYINSAPEDAENIDNIFTTLAHEGYPGHMYQQTYFNNTNPDKMRLLLDYSGYIEGWATYVEMLAYDWAYENPNMADCMRANQQLGLYLSARSDIGIHYEGWTRADFKQYLGDSGFNNDDETVDLMYNIILQSPANYLSYAIGDIMFDELREKAADQLDDKFDETEFHKFILETGPAPFDLIESRMDTWIESL